MRSVRLCRAFESEERLTLKSLMSPNIRALLALVSSLVQDPRGLARVETTTSRLVCKNELPSTLSLVRLGSMDVNHY